jgi:hypothetical protein
VWSCDSCAHRWLERVLLRRVVVLLQHAVVALLPAGVQPPPVRVQLTSADVAQFRRVPCSLEKGPLHVVRILQDGV